MAGHIVRKIFSGNPSSKMFKLMSFWPPLAGAGISVVEASPDNMYLKVEMPLRWYNRNFVGTHFGGSLYAMTDPFYMLQLIAHLGKDYIVWDKAASIQFVSPGKGRVSAEFKWTPEEIEKIRIDANEKEKLVFDKNVTVKNSEGKIIAEVTKTLYVRKKSQSIRAM